MPEVRLVLVTAPDENVAEQLARALVDEQLAACVTILPGARSIYRWEGKVERADEVQLIAKTTAGALAALTGRVVALHPYDVPEVIALAACGGLPAYLTWVAESVAQR